MQAQDQPEQAVSHFQEVVRLNPKHAEAQLNLGVLLANLDKLDQAEQAYLAALKLNPNLVEGYYNLEFSTSFTARILIALWNNTVNTSSSAAGRPGQETAEKSREVNHVASMNEFGQDSSFLRFGTWSMCCTCSSSCS